MIPSTEKWNRRKFNLFSDSFVQQTIHKTIRRISIHCSSIRNGIALGKHSSFKTAS
jgi:hypothetical protein